MSTVQMPMHSEGLSAREAGATRLDDFSSGPGPTETPGWPDAIHAPIAWPTSGRESRPTPTLDGVTYVTSRYGIHLSVTLHG